MSNLGPLSMANGLGPVHPPSGGPSPTEWQERKPNDKERQRKKRDISPKEKEKRRRGDKNRLDIEA